MGKNEGEQKQFAGIERITIALYTVYGLMMFFAIVQRESMYLNAVAIFCLLVCIWAVFLSRFQTYRIRAVCYSILELFLVLIYSLHINSVFYLVMLLLNLLVLTGLLSVEYGITAVGVGSAVIFGWSMWGRFFKRRRGVRSYFRSCFFTARSS